MWMRDIVTVCIRGTGDGLLRLSIRRRRPRPSRTRTCIPHLRRPIQALRVRNHPTSIRSEHYLRSGWDEHEFRLVVEPYSWCDDPGRRMRLSRIGGRTERGLLLRLRNSRRCKVNVRASPPTPVRRELKAMGFTGRQTGRGTRKNSHCTGIAVIRMAEATLPHEPDPDRLIIVVETDFERSKGRGGDYYRAEEPYRGSTRFQSLLSDGKIVWK